MIALSFLSSMVWAAQVTGANPTLAARVSELFRTAVVEEQPQSAAAHAEASRLYVARGLLTINEVGDEAALRRKVLPMLKAAVDAGQADPSDYTKVADRTARDEGRAQQYGENLECSPDRPVLHRAPIDDEAHVNMRRAAMGLIRLEIYERIVIAESPALCGPPAVK